MGTSLFAAEKKQQKPKIQPTVDEIIRLKNKLKKSKDDLKTKTPVYCSYPNCFYHDNAMTGSFILDHLKEDHFCRKCETYTEERCPKHERIRAIMSLDKYNLQKKAKKESENR